MNDKQPQYEQVPLNRCNRCTQGILLQTYHDDEPVCHLCGFIPYGAVEVQRTQHTSGVNAHMKSRPSSYRPHPMKQATLTFGFADKHMPPASCQWYEPCERITTRKGMYCTKHRKLYGEMWGKHPPTWDDMAIATRIARVFIQYEYVPSLYGEEECPFIIPGKRAALSQLWIPEVVGLPDMHRLRQDRTYMRLRKALEKKLGPLKFFNEAIQNAEFYDRDGPSLKLYANLIKEEHQALQKDITGSSEV